MEGKQKQTNKKSTDTTSTKTDNVLHAKAETNKPSSQNVEKSSHKSSILKTLCWKLRWSYIREQIMFHFSRIKCDKAVTTAIRYPQPFQIHHWDQECDVIKKYTQLGGKDINWPPSRPTDKKRTTYAKPWEGTDAFSLPESKKIVKKVNQRFFKDGVVRQKSAHKNFIKKVVVWGFLSVMREKRESNGEKVMRKCTCVHVCVWAH